MTIGMRSKKGPLISMALSFNNRGPFGGFYRYIGEEDTYKIYRDSMTDSEGKEIALDGMTAFDRQDVEFVSAIREGREPESSAASCGERAAPRCPRIGTAERPHGSWTSCSNPAPPEAHLINHSSRTIVFETHGHYA